MRNQNKRRQLWVIAALMISALFAACSQDDDTEADNPVAPEPKEYVYTMHLTGDAPSYDGDATRAGASWSNGATIYLRFTSGSSTISGTAVYNSSTGLWTVTANSSLSITSSSNCTAYYFENTSSVSSTLVYLTEKSISYVGYGTYSRPTSSELYVNVTLKPATSRLRMKGTSGTSISLLGKSDITYLSSYGRATGTLYTTTKDVSLTVASTGYTPYVYGNLNNSSGTNTIYVQNGGYTYSRSVAGTSLSTAESAYMEIPTQSNYSSLGWTRGSQYVANCDTKIVNTTLGYLSGEGSYILYEYQPNSRVSRCRVAVYKTSETNDLSNDQIINKMLEGGDRNYWVSVSNMNGYFYIESKLSTNTQYVIYTYCTDENGDHGNLLNYSFTTKSSSAPKAQISSFYSSTYNNTSVWRFSLSKMNGAAYYYSGYLQYSSAPTDDYYSLIRSFSNAISDNLLSRSSDWSSKYFYRTNTYCVLMTWGVGSSYVLGIEDLQIKYVTSGARAMRIAPIDIKPNDNLGRMRKKADTRKFLEQPLIIDPERQ